jgi:hypothetical protein
VGFVVDKAVVGQVFFEYFGFPYQSFHQFIHHYNHPGLAQYGIRRRSTEWTRLYQLYSIKKRENSEGRSVVELGCAFSCGLLTGGQRKLKK